MVVRCHRLQAVLALLACVVSAVVVAAQHASPTAPVNLKLEYLDSPVVGVDVLQPRFSYSIMHVQRGILQSHYQIVVYMGDNNNVVMWDSGQVQSNQTSNIVYKGSSLQSDTTYYWKVRWWAVPVSRNSAPVVSPYSVVTTFDMALLKVSDWQNAQWIGGFNQIRREFSVNSPISRARAYICGLGYHELYINGKKVGDHRLDPGWTSYHVRSLYVAHDVTDYLVAGDNAVAVMLGNGWYGQGWKAPQSLLFVLSITPSTTQTKQYIISDTSSGSWKGKQGPITMDSIYNGETYDARMETPGWTSAGFDDSSWAPATSVSAPGGVLSVQMIPPIREHVTLKPINMTQPKQGVYVFDFGQNFSGWCKLYVTGSGGTTVTLRHAEILQSDGSGMIYTDNLRTAKATDTYTLKGSVKGEVYEPHFTYHGFRFVEVTGYPGTPTLSSLVGVHAYSSVASSGSIVFNHPVLNRIQSNIEWGQQSNLMSVPTDCDQRDERLGWMADGHLSCVEAMHNFFVPAFYSHWVTLMTDDDITGQVADTVPFIRYGGRPGDPAWTAAFPIVLFEIYNRYGDTAILSEQYSSLTTYIDWMSSKVQQQGIGKLFGSYGDWVPPPPAPKASISFTSAWFFLVTVKQTVTIATALGRTSDVTKYSNLYTQLSAQFNQAFYNMNSNTYDNGVQTALLLPLWLDVVPAMDVQNVTVNFLNDVVTTQNYHLTTGILGTRYLMEAIDTSRQVDIGLELALQTTYPSWGYMIYQTAEVSATTLWELWDSPSEGPGMNSRNHIMFGSVGSWFYSTLAGIKQDESTVGYQRLVIEPPPVAVLVNSPLTSVNASLDFNSGQISVSWLREGGSLCSRMPENSVMQLSCGEDGGIIQSIDFVSFGTAIGTCGGYSYGKCNAASSRAIVEKACLSQRSCAIQVSDKVFGDPCYGTVKQLSVQVTCSNPNVFKLNTVIPTGLVADIRVPKLDLTNVVVMESGTKVWVNNAYQSGVAGIVSASALDSSISFLVGSGSYAFAVAGTQGTTICSTAQEHDVVSLTCPKNDQSIVFVKFASYGTPTVVMSPDQLHVGTCKNFQYGSCHAGSSKYIVEQQCLYKTECSIDVEDWYFGDPCYLTKKNFAVEVVCA